MFVKISKTFVKSGNKNWSNTFCVPAAVAENAGGHFRRSALVYVLPQLPGPRRSSLLYSKQLRFRHKTGDSELSERWN